MILLDLLSSSASAENDWLKIAKSKGADLLAQGADAIKQSRQGESGDRVRDNDILNFRQAKTVLKRSVYNTPEMKQTFYCGCDYKGATKMKGAKPYYYAVDTKSCGFKPPAGHRNPDWAKTIEWEHLFTSHAMGKDLACWKKGGRKECQKSSAVYNECASDLRNLVPAIKLVNRDRLNYKFAEIDGEPTDYGQCGLEIDKRNRIVEPDDSIKGDLARSYLFMSQRYDIPLTQKETDMFQRWSELDPLDAREQERINRLSKYNH